MTSALLGLFALSVAWVFVQAFQSRNINSGQFTWAALCSWLIGNLQVLVLSSVIGPHSSFLSTQAYCLGGAIGVVLAMHVHRFLLRSKDTPTHDSSQSSRLHPRRHPALPNEP